MRVANDTITFAGATTGDMSGSLTSDPFRLEHLDLIAIQASFSGSTPTGTFKLQACCDMGTIHAYGGMNNVSGLSVWTDIAGSSNAVSANGDIVWNIVDPGFRWVRLVYTRTSGTGTLSVRANAKGRQ